MKNKYFREIVTVVTIIIIYIGFRLVTQAGQGLDIVQNDGYAGTGGFVILVGGFLLGLCYRYNQKKQ